MEIQIKRPQARPCMVDGENRALLHEVWRGFATVEYEDGSFNVINVEKVQTLDSTEEFDGCGWGEA